MSWTINLYKTPTEHLIYFSKDGRHLDDQDRNSHSSRMRLCAGQDWLFFDWFQPSRAVAQIRRINSRLRSQCRGRSTYAAFTAILQCEVYEVKCEVGQDAG